MNSPTCRGLGPRPILTLSSRLRRHALLKRLSLLTLAFTFFSAGAAPQKKPAEQNDRIVLEQILTQTYQPSQVGKQLMGIGGETDIRRAGTIVVIQRRGLFGSLLHTEPASSAIDGIQYKLFRGHQDYEVPAGERYYVTAIAVGSDTVLVALISARGISTQAGTGRMWTTLSFKFPANVLATADKETVFRELDQWFMPEGHATSSAFPAPPAAPAITASPAATPVAAVEAVIAGAAGGAENAKEVAWP